MLEAIRVCVNCVEFIANGHIRDREQLVQINWNWGGFRFELANDIDEHFSWQPCEMCSTKLGGARYMAFAIDEKC